MIPALFGGKCYPELRKLFSLPARLGGLGLKVPSEEAALEYEYSLNINKQLIDAIFNQESSFEVDPKIQSEKINETKKQKASRYETLQAEFKSKLTKDLWKVIELSAEKGASMWLTTIPIVEHGFRLNKQQFLDALCMRYDLNLNDVPRKCYCGENYSINHCLTCRNGGFVIMRHNAVRDSIFDMVNETCKDVKLEPALLPLSGETFSNKKANVSEGARSDISALGLWQPMCRAFLDIRVFNPLAQTNWQKQIPDMYVYQEGLKKDEYNERILEVEKASFTPLVFSCSGGASIETTKFLKKLAKLLSEKKNEPYSATMSYVRRRIRFDILRSCIISFRGERAPRNFVKISNAECHLTNFGRGGN